VFGLLAPANALDMANFTGRGSARRARVGLGLLISDVGVLEEGAKVVTLKNNNLLNLESNAGFCPVLSCKSRVT
jgi:hypothetical protein